MKKLANFFKKDNKGFTLVEIIVVLAILAILIAVALPSMTGILNESKGKVLMQDARAALVAIQLKLTDTPDSAKITGTEVLALIDKPTTGGTVSISVKYDTSKKPHKITHIIYGDTAKVTGKVIMITSEGKEGDTGKVFDDFTKAQNAAPGGTWVALVGGSSGGGSSAT